MGFLRRLGYRQKTKAREHVVREPGCGCTVGFADQKDPASGRVAVGIATELTVACWPPRGLVVRLSESASSRFAANQIRSSDRWTLTRRATFDGARVTSRSVPQRSAWMAASHPRAADGHLATVRLRRGGRCCRPDKPARNLVRVGHVPNRARLDGRVAFASPKAPACPAGAVLRWNGGGRSPLVRCGWVL